MRSQQRAAPKPRTKSKATPEKRHPLHSMCSYLGSFPPRVPAKLIEELIPKGRTVLDPFCGSGTTLVEARLRGRGCIGIDRNPLAVAVAHAKLQPVTLEEIEDRLIDLGRNYSGIFDADPL